MRKLAVTFLLVVCAVLSAGATEYISEEPDYTLLWNSFSAVTVDSCYALASGADGLVLLTCDSLSGQYRETDHVFLNARGIAHKRYGDTLAIQTGAGIIYFFNLGSLPVIEKLGEADLGAPFTDFALSGNDLYICEGFEGLWRYSLDNLSNPQFADSSMLGIHYAHVEIEGDYLYALDDYNGILRYDISGPGFGVFEDYLFVPFQVSSFALSDSLVVMPVTQNRLMLGTFGGPSPTVFDTLSLMMSPDRVYVRDTMALVFSNELPVLGIVSLNTFDQFTAQLTEPPDTNLQVDFFVEDDDTHMLLTASDGGLVTYNLTDIAFNNTPFRALARPGPISDLLMHRGFLYAAGFGNPVDRFDIAPDGAPSIDTTLYPGITGASALAANGDTLAIMYSELQSMFAIDISNDSLTFLGSARPDGFNVNDLFFGPTKLDSFWTVFSVSPDLVELFAVTDSFGIQPRATVSIVDDIIEATVIDSLLFLSNGKTGISVYRIYNNTSIEYRTSIGFSFDPTHIFAHDNRLYAFSGPQLVVFSIGDPSNIVSDTIVPSPGRVVNSVVDGSILYAVGPGGVSLFDLSGSAPELMAYGGRGGSMIAEENGIVAVSDGYSVHIFDTRNIPTDIIDDVPGDLPVAPALAQNYPNPFNPVTSIPFSLSVSSDVELTVFNVLGQIVSVLVDEQKPAGNYLVDWGGQNDSGEEVASGVYFYRLVTADRHESRKMLLIR